MPPARWSLHRHVRLASTQRRAQNLSERYRKLENTTRAKPEPISLLHPNGNIPARTTPPDTIAGFVIPTEPRAPADDECCMSGCAVCVYDVYEEALVAYKESVATLRTALAVRDIPESEWPVHIRTGKDKEAGVSVAAAEKTKGAVLDAFEEMERALKEKRDRRAMVEAEKRERGEVLTDDEEDYFRGVFEGIKWILFPNR